MNEVKIKSKRQNLILHSIIALVVLSVLITAVIIIVGYFVTDVIKQLDSGSFFSVAGTLCLETIAPIVFVLIAAVNLVLYFSKYSMTVYASHIEVRMFRKKTCMPIRSITSVSRVMFNSILVVGVNSKVICCLLKNADEIYELLTNIVLENGKEYDASHSV